MKKSAWDVVLANQGLVGSVIKKEFGWILRKCYVMDFQDLFQIGLMGLHRAAQKYDNKRGYTLGTYAYAWIKQFIMRAYAMEGFRFTRIPVHNMDKVTALTRRLDKGESLRELFDDGEITECTYQAAKISLGEKSFVELDAPVADGGSETVGAIFVADESTSLQERLQKADVESAVRRMLEKLTPRERYVLEKRYGIGDGEAWTFEKAGQVMDVSRERVRQIQVKAQENLIKHFQKSLITFEELV